MANTHTHTLSLSHLNDKFKPKGNLTSDDEAKLKLKKLFIIDNFLVKLKLFKIKLIFNCVIYEWMNEWMNEYVYFS